MSLPDAAAYLGRLTGQKPHISTLWRWCLKGCKGVRLESIAIGGKRYVTASALDHFVEATTAATTRPVAPAITRPVGAASPPAPAARVMRHTERRRVQIEAARRRLDELTGVTTPKPPATRSA